jgi:hypothetical protein
VILGIAGYDIVRKGWAQVPPDADPADVETLRIVSPYTLTIPPRVIGLCEAVRYVVDRGIPGDLVECGAWRGGSMMAVALTLLRIGDTSRHLYLYDTFEGMPHPDDVDRAILDGRPASQYLAESAKGDRNGYWCTADEEDVRRNMALTKYPVEQMHFVRGAVEETIPRVVPNQIALLRLDTDWYSSTRHELEHLYPRLVPGGVLIVDDYGYWSGARKAVDEYFAKSPVLLLRLDSAARIAIRS